MNRREFIKNGLYAGAGVSFLGCAHGALSLSNPGINVRAGQRPPNILFLLTDDQRWDAMSCMGNPILQTPNMDDLARRGVLFTNAFVTTSICMSSRASILTGQYMRRHKIQNFSQSLTTQQFSQTYTSLLRSAGYRTGFIGKHGLGSFPSGEFDYYKGFDGQGTYNAKDEDGNPIHLTALIARQAVEFLEQSRADVPFCLSISFKAPHVEGLNTFLYDTQYENLYKDVTIPYPATYENQYWDAFPERFKQPDSRLNEARSRWQVRFSTPQAYQNSVKGYYRLLAGVDQAIGTIRRHLSRLELDENTVIIFASDNGFYLAELGMAGKWYGHDPSIRIPLIIYDPRVSENEQGRTFSQMVLNIDIAPTILSYAGLKSSGGMQGNDLRPLLAGDSAPWRTDFLYEQMYDNGGNIPVCEGVVQERYKYIRFFALSPVYEQLYDLQNDPHEITNLAADPAHASILKDLRDRCAQLIAQNI
jgi:arylsulfatase A-like enzyme